MKRKQYLAELRDLSLEELRKKLEDSKQELFNLRFQLATSSLDNIAAIRKTKRDIARIHTLIREQELGINR